MRLVNDLSLTAWERQHAWSSEQALERVHQALLDRQTIEGLADLRATLMIDLDSEVLERVGRTPVPASLPGDGGQRDHPTPNGR